MKHGGSKIRMWRGPGGKKRMSNIEQGTLKCEVDAPCQSFILRHSLFDIRYSLG